MPSRRSGGSAKIGKKPGCGKRKSKDSRRLRNATFRENCDLPDPGFAKQQMERRDRKSRCRMRSIASRRSSRAKSLGHYVRDSSDTEEERAYGSSYVSHFVDHRLYEKRKRYNRVIKLRDDWYIVVEPKNHEEYMINTTIEQERRTRIGSLCRLHNTYCQGCDPLDNYGEPSFYDEEELYPEYSPYEISYY